MPPGPPGNIINGLAIDHDGVLWCASSYDGIFRFDGQTWRQYTTADGLINNAVEMVMVDSQNRKWFGGIGSGLVLIDANDKITVFYNEILSGINEDPNWVVVSDVKEDQYNNIWILNSFAANNNVVAVYTPQQQWYFFSVQEGILSKVLTSLDFDRTDRVWVGTQSGVSVIDYNNTLANKTDDVIAGNNLTTADGLENNNIKDVVIDQDEIVWIATEAGVNYWNPAAPQKVSYQYGLLSNSVNSVEVDIRNNKWFGTSAGVSILGSDGYTWTHYSTDNSPLVNDNVSSFGFDFETGKVYIGTANGLSVLETPYSRPREDLSQVKAGPNPFFAVPGNEFTFLDLADDVSIKIMTENGMIVRKIDNENILGAVTSWDGKNSNDEYVASGIYLYVIYNEDTGQNRVGKIAVVRE
jgi:ligand-binding sensor domain-containing protein